MTSPFPMRKASVAELLLTGAYDENDPLFLVRHAGSRDATAIPSILPGQNARAPMTIGAATAGPMDKATRQRYNLADKIGLGAANKTIDALKLFSALSGASDVEDLRASADEGDGGKGALAAGSLALGALPIGVPRRIKGIKKVLAGLREEAALKGAAGMTLDATTLKPFAGSGYMVGSASRSIGKELTEEAVAKVVGKLGKNKHLGIWFDPDSRHWFVEPTQAVESLEEATKLGAKRKQIAIGHIQDGAYVGDIKLAHAPNPSVEDVAGAYMKRSGVKGQALKAVTAINEPAARKMAQVYDDLVSDPTNPEVRAAYDALAQETRQQYRDIVESGFRFEFTDGDPYKTSAEMMRDVRENRRLKVFKTAEGQSHPILSNEDNDIFRAVHDYFGHARGGNQFGPLGEEAAYRSHSAMYSPLARRAMATETRGQNSWVNFGRQAAGKSAKDRPFATQKAALWPEDMLGEYGPMTRTSSKPVPSMSPEAKELHDVLSPRQRAALEAGDPRIQREHFNAYASASDPEAYRAAVMAGSPLARWYEQLKAASKGRISEDDQNTLFQLIGAGFSTQNPPSREAVSALKTFAANKAGKTPGQAFRAGIGGNKPLEAQKQNVIRVLESQGKQAPNPYEILSGPKVQNYAGARLPDEVLAQLGIDPNDPVALDLWETMLEGYPQKTVSGRKNTAGGRKVEDARYLGPAAMRRRLAEQLGVRTSAVQSSGWHFGKGLMDELGRRAYGVRSGKPARAGLPLVNNPRGRRALVDLGPEWALREGQSIVDNPQAITDYLSAMETPSEYFGLARSPLAPSLGSADPDALRRAARNVILSSYGQYPFLARLK